MAAFAGVACLAFAGMANAQTSNASAAALARANNQAVASAYVQPRNASGSAVSTDGAVEAGEDQSGFSNAGVGGAFDTLSGVGATGAGEANFGGALNVVTQAATPGTVQGSQINTGGGGATASPNGGVFNADQTSQQR